MFPCSWAKCVNPKAPTLFVGVDVSHPDAAELRRGHTHDHLVSSCASVVANVDVDAMQSVLPLAMNALIV